MTILLFAENIFQDLVTRRGVSTLLKNIYTKEDATIEIVTMLIGSFLFGFLFRHFLGFFTKRVIIKSKEKNENLAPILEEETAAANSLLETKSEVKEEAEKFEFTAPISERKEENHELFLPKNDLLTESRVEEPIINIASTPIAETPVEIIVPEVQTSIVNRIVEPIILEETAPIIEMPLPVVPETKEAMMIDFRTIQTPPPVFEAPIIDYAQELIKAEPEEQTPVQSIQTNHDLNDLKTIEGIGPAIEKLLNSNGITSFSHLAMQSKSSLEKILDEAGPRFRVHVPDMWPEQARLLSENNIIAYNELTDSILNKKG